MDYSFVDNLAGCAIFYPMPPGRLSHYPISTIQKKSTSCLGKKKKISKNLEPISYYFVQAIYPRNHWILCNLRSFTDVFQLLRRWLSPSRNSKQAHHITVVRSVTKQQSSKLATWSCARSVQPISPTCDWLQCTLCCQLDLEQYCAWWLCCRNSIRSILELPWSVGCKLRVGHKSGCLELAHTLPMSRNRSFFLPSGPSDSAMEGASSPSIHRLQPLYRSLLISPWHAICIHGPIGAMSVHTWIPYEERRPFGALSHRTCCAVRLQKRRPQQKS